MLLQIVPFRSSKMPVAVFSPRRVISPCLDAGQPEPRTASENKLGIFPSQVLYVTCLVLATLTDAGRALITGTPAPSTSI